MMRRTISGLSALSMLSVLAACRSNPVLAAGDGGAPDSGLFACTTADTSFCEGDVSVRCEARGASLEQVRTDCSLRGGRCLVGACQACIPDTLGCFEGNPARCLADGSAWETTGSCDLAAGQACRFGACVNLCEESVVDRSYVGCEFFPVDLDTQGLAFPPFGIIVSNPNPFTTRVVLEVDDAEPGQAPRLRTLAEAEVPSDDLEVFSLPRRRIDGRPQGADWLETGSALTRGAYRVRSRHPVIAYQFNPLAQADVYSNDASLLLPTSALGTRTTVLGWPQTLATRGTAAQRSPSDYRSTLTVVGTAVGTEVTVRFGRAVERVLGLSAMQTWTAGDTATFTLGPLDTLNLETDGFLADFTGTLVTSSAPVAIYTGSEGADVPAFESVSDRRCCADHLEDQLVPDSSLGTAFALARTPARAGAINLSLADPSAALPESDEFEIVRVLAVTPGTTRIDTGLRAPFDAFTLEEGEAATLVLDRDTTLVADRPVSLIQLLASQDAVGIPGSYPGGDPALIVLPPVDQYRTDYVFLTPSTYAFDAVTIVAAPGTEILLDDEPLPGTCERRELTGPATGPGARWELHRCPLSFPEIGGDFAVRGGVQGDGVHRIRADRPVGVVVSGFDLYVSYAYAAGMNLEVLR